MKLRPRPLVLEAFPWTADPAQEGDPVGAIDALNNRKIVVVNAGTPLARLRIVCLYLAQMMDALSGQNVKS
jgi:hypothetical protein